MLFFLENAPFIHCGRTLLPTRVNRNGIDLVVGYMYENTKGASTDNGKTAANGNYRLVNFVIRFCLFYGKIVFVTGSAGASGGFGGGGGSFGKTETAPSAEPAKDSSTGGGFKRTFGAKRENDAEAPQTETESHKTTKDTSDIMPGKIASFAERMGRRVC